MKKYGLLLRQPQQKKPPRPPLPTALGFGEEEEDDVEKEISRQAAKKKSLKDVSKLFQSLSSPFFFFLYLLYI